LNYSSNVKPRIKNKIFGNLPVNGRYRGANRINASEFAPLPIDRASRQFLSLAILRATT
jgi:hypothetical protein